ncbi:MAG TPA: acetyl-CoA carboxylase biotin carboxyl carrier protein [Steroidobacteraceae bacterium]|nr:acetyl-CoA carboxylase biotin carboxyl carrier protein [Steroidobacteraceae bacterium]
MDIRKVKKLIELLEESGIAEIEIKEGEESVRISRGATGTPAPQYFSLPAPAPAAAAAPAPAASAAADSATAPLARRKDDENVISAPMVGTYYAAASPTAKPFVAIGDEVKEGQVLCIIEAMKMMNQIESDRAGKVTAIMCQNGDPVEFGQPLFVVE